MFEPNWDKIPNRNMHRAIHNYIMHGIHPGSFLTSFLCNDLKSAASNADDTNGPLLYEWVRFFYNEAPGACWGSPERFHAWLAQGGLLGNKSTEPQS